MLKRILSSFFVRLSVALINFAVLIISSKQLGSEIVGQMSLMILNMAIVQTIVEIYTGSTLVHFIPQFNFSKIYKFGLSWLILGVIFCNLVFYYFNIGLSEFAIHIFILSLMVCWSSFHSIILLAFEKIKLFNFYTLLQPLLISLVLSFNIFIEHDYSIWAFLNAWYFSFSIVLLYTVVALLISEVKVNQTEFNFYKIIKNGFMNQMANLSHTLSNRLNYYLLGSAALVGVYANSTSMIEALWIISASISPIILTHVANKRQEAMQGQLTLLLSKICFLISLIGVAVLYLLPDSFFTSLLGSDFAQTKQVMLYLSPGVLMISFSSIISHYFSGHGMQKIQLGANLTGLLVAVLTSYFFIKQFGIIGAGISATCSYGIQALILIIVFMKHNQMKLSSLFTLKSELKLFKE